MSRDSNHKNVRVDDGKWSAALARATGEGHTLSGLIRQWIDDYVATGSPVGKGRQAPVRVTAAERAAVRESLGGLDIVGIVVDTINKERG
jgi:hypothetical protein